MGTHADLVNSRMYEAIKNNDLPALRKAIKDGADVNSRDALDNSTPLFDACEHDSIGAIHILIKNGADVNARDRYEETPFFKVCEGGHMDTARLLLEKGADVNVGNRFGYTSLHSISIDWTQNPVSRIHFLVSHGADIDVKDRDGNTPLHWACFHSRPDTARLLLENGADPGISNNSAFTPLDAAMDIPENNPHREEILDLFREYAPNLVMEKFCSSGPGGT